MATKVDEREFQAEARQLLRIVVSSIYSNKDIFLRELISNAADALDKLRLEMFRNKDLEADTSDLHVEVEIDKDNRTLTVRDNGIGMSGDEVVDVIGTVAKSGTAELLKSIDHNQSEGGRADFIGQFGVGFYASFMVADKVTLESRRAGDAAGVRWESTGEATYTIEVVDDVPQGTVVTLHLKPVDIEDGLFDYTDERKIREIVARYSDFITWPIRMRTGSVSDDEDGEGTDESVETINSTQALWARPKADVEPGEYADFYKRMSYDWRDPLEVIHLRAEGSFEYQALLFIPPQAPLDLYLRDARRGPQLYVKRVHVMDDCDVLLPEYLRFVKGVVDAQDLSLNISREVLQHDRQIQLMRRRLTKKVLATITSMMSDRPAIYRTFWSEFGRVMKEGLLADFDNRDLLLEALSFASTRDPEQLTTLQSYIERMKEGQEHIYYVTGESRSVIESSPHMEAFDAKGYEVLLLTDPIDEMWVASVPEYNGKPLQSIAASGITIDDQNEASDEEAAEEGAGQEERGAAKPDFDGLLAWMGEALHDDVEDVRLSSRLTTSPACLVSDGPEISPTLEKMYRAMGQDMPHVKRVLELNPGHTLVEGIRRAHQERADDPVLAETAELLYGLALLAEGGELRDPSRFSRLLANRLARTL